MLNNEKKNLLRRQIETNLSLRDYDAAMKSAVMLAENKPTEAEGLAAMTSIYIEAGQPDLARASLQKLLQYSPKDSYALFLQCRLDLQEKRYDTASKGLKKVMQHHKLSNTLLEKICNLAGQCCRILGECAQSVQYYRQAAAAADTLPLKAMEYSNVLFNLHYQRQTAAEMLLQAKEYGQLFSKIKPYSHRLFRNHKKLRIGYISPDFRNHVVLHFCWTLLTEYDEDRFEVYCYANNAEDRYSHQLMQRVTAWRNISRYTAEEAAQQIYQDEIDILVDLAGHTQGNCLPVLAHKPAPLQISGIGYFSTTGLPAVDYFIGDTYLDKMPAGIGSNDEFIEKMLVLPHSHFCYTPGETVSLQVSPCLRNGYITYGSFNNFTKVNDQVLRVWGQILHAVPEAHLLLKAALFDSEEGRQSAEERMRTCGIDCRRVELRGFSRDYLPEYCEMDIALDTFPYPGGGTTTDALYMGVPVISLRGKDHGSRFGYSLLMNIGLGELCAVDEASYVQLAVSLAQEPSLLGDLHQQIRSMMMRSPVMDGKQYTQTMEKFYQEIWEKRQRERPSLSGREKIEARQELQRCLQRGTVTAALLSADRLLSAGDYSQEIGELLAGIYIDSQESVNAQRVIEQLLAKQDYGYGLFLRARLELLKHEQQAAIRDAGHALQLGEMSAQQRSLTHNLLGRLYREIGQPELAVPEDRQAAQAAVYPVEKAASYSNYLFSLHYLKESPQFMYQEACRYDQIWTGIKQYKHERKKRHEKLRIGYISPDFCYHIVALFSYAFFMHFETDRFEVYGYSCCPENPISQEFAAHADHWRNLAGQTADDIASQIYADEIDILVDLSGHTQNNCLPVLAYRPAPVQVSGIGWFNTTGLRTVDYFLADPYTDPEGLNDEFFTEKLLRLPHSHFCYCAYGKEEAIGMLPYHRNKKITFGCFNNFAKVTDELLAIWSTILQAVPESELFLKTAIFDYPYSRDRALERISRAGIPLSRVRTEGHTADYLAAYNRVDIALDTYPYPGGGTTCDALYMGVPVITRVGQRHNARFGYSLLMNIGLEECCSSSDEEYAAYAIRLAENPQRLRTIRQTLRRRMQESPVMDEAGYMAELEAVYDRIWQDWLYEGNPKQQREVAVQSQASLTKAWNEENWPVVIRQAAVLRSIPKCQPVVYMMAGFAYYQQQDYTRAIGYLQEALRLDKEHDAEICLLLSEAEKGRQNYPSARELARQAEKLAGRTEKPAGCEFQYRVILLKAYLERITGQASAAESYRQASELAIQLSDKMSMYSSYLLALHDTEIGAVDLFAVHEHYRSFFKEIQPLPARNVIKHQKIRIGYLSPDFRQHVMFSFYYALFACYNHEAFQIYAYSLTDKPDGYTAQIRAMADEWRDLTGKSYAKMAECIRADEIDILVDLAGHSTGSGLPVLGFRPSPVQVSGLGYMNTTGLDTVDYFLTDVWADPKGEHEKLFSETLWYMDSQFCYVGRNDVPVPRGAVALKRGYIVFGVFNHYYKYTDRMMIAWKAIMERVPESRLLLKCQAFGSLALIDEAWERLNRLGLDMEKVIFEPASVDYMERYMDVDIALDTYPYPGGGTTCDALYMGVPVISLYGERRGSRFGLSLLQNVGIGELAVNTVEDYIERAVELAGDRDLLNQLHVNLRAMMQQSAVMDTPRYMRQLEQHYHAACEERIGQ